MRARTGHRAGSQPEAAKDEKQGIRRKRGTEECAKQGSKIYHRGKHMHIPALAVTDIKDPTGCGDAYRAGLIYGIMHQLDWLTTGQIATLLGALKIQHHGTQNHHFTLDQFKHQFEAAYGKTF